MRTKIYIAGSMFSEAEIAARRKEEQLIRLSFPFVNIYNPISAPFNDNKASLPTPEDIYTGDFKEIVDCDILLADLGCFYDGGLMMEIGIAAALNEVREKPILLLGVLSDIRLATANQYPIPSLGYNHMVIGSFDRWGTIVNSFEKALDEIKHYIERETRKNANTI